MTEHDTLGILLKAIEPFAKPGTLPPEGSSVDANLSVAATAMLRAAYIQAAGVYVLCEGTAWEAAGANIRGLVEALIEMHELLKVGVASDNAVKMCAFALLELGDYHAKYGGDAGDLATIETRLASLSANSPGPVQAIKNQIKNKQPPYWSGRSRSAMLKDTDAWSANFHPDKLPNLFKQGYKLLSWEAHHVMALLQHVGVDPGAKQVVVVTSQGAEDSEFYSGMGARLLALTWELYSEQFGVHASI